VAANDADRPIRILYISDIDFRARTAWDADPVRRDLVPGNRDADPCRVGKGARQIHDGQLAERSEDAITELLQDPGERDLVLKRHTAYLVFYGG
jgi:hypothetical protein